MSTAIEITTRRLHDGRMSVRITKGAATLEIGVVDKQERSELARTLREAADKLDDMELP